jgi:hypothetical protein
MDSRSLAAIGLATTFRCPRWSAVAKESFANANRNGTTALLAGLDGSGSSNLEFQWDALFGLGRVPEISIKRHYRR